MQKFVSTFRPFSNALYSSATALPNKDAASLFQDDLWSYFVVKLSLFLSDDDVNVGVDIDVNAGVDNDNDVNIGIDNDVNIGVDSDVDTDVNVGIDERLKVQPTTLIKQLRDDWRMREGVTFSFRERIKRER